MNVFETMLVIGGRIVQLDEHVARMGQPCRQVAFDAIRDDEEHAIRVVYEDGRLTATAFTIPEITRSRRVHGRVVTLPASITRPMPQFKRYPEDLHLRHLIPDGADEALFVTPDGDVLEGTSTNVFALRDDTLITAPDGVLPGIVRGRVLARAPKLGFRIEYRPPTVDDLLHGGFLTSSLTTLAPIRTLNGQASKIESVMNAILLLLTLTTSTLVLRSGDRIAVEGTLKHADGVYTFRSGGLLYSLPASEVERVEDSQPVVAEKPKLKLRLSDDERKRLLDELEKNHGGTAPPPAPQDFVPEAPKTAVEPHGDEHEWRARARSYEEGIRRAQEELRLLESRIEELRNQIHSFVSLGYNARQFTYQTSQLALAQEQLPYARLEVTRAERAWAEFKEDARKAGVMPGWLR